MPEGVTTRPPLLAFSRSGSAEASSPSRCAARPQRIPATRSCCPRRRKASHVDRHPLLAPSSIHRAVRIPVMLPYLTPLLASFRVIGRFSCWASVTARSRVERRSAVISSPAFLSVPGQTNARHRGCRDESRRSRLLLPIRADGRDTMRSCPIAPPDGDVVVDVAHAVFLIGS